MSATTTRFLLSPCGHHFAHVDASDVTYFPGWTDCTDMDDEQFQAVVGERLADRTYIVGMAI